MGAKVGERALLPPAPPDNVGVLTCGGIAWTLHPTIRREGHKGRGVRKVGWLCPSFTMACGAGWCTHPASQGALGRLVPPEALSLEFSLGQCGSALPSASADVL